MAPGALRLMNDHFSCRARVSIARAQRSRGRRNLSPIGVPGIQSKPDFPSHRVPDWCIVHPVLRYIQLQVTGCSRVRKLTEAKFAYL